MARYLKFAAQVAITALAGIAAALQGGDRLTASEWINVLLLALGAVGVLGAGELPAGVWSRTKTFVAAAAAGAVLLQSALSGGVTPVEWMQIALAVIGALGVHAVPGPVLPLLEVQPPTPAADPLIEQWDADFQAWKAGLPNLDDTQEMQPVIAAQPHIRRPNTVTVSYDGREVATAYGLDPKWTGKGYIGGIVELGGGFGTTDLRGYFKSLGVPAPAVTAVTVAGGKNSSDGPNGADGEVLLDIEVAGAVAPGASYRVYFAPNTGDGFLAAVERAVKECDAVSISWGGPESSWDPATIDAFDAVFADARRAGVPVFVAAGDTGSRDGTGGNAVDFPASSPNVVGCGGTRLAVNSHGERQFEVVWDDNDTSSATGGGVSAHFPGRDVPDVAGNADPVTGYRVLVDGEQAVIGGTSAVAPLYLGMFLALLEATGGKRFDFLNTVATNPEICFDVTQGDNGGFRAGPGRDQTTGFGVVDAGKLFARLVDPIPDPVPPGPAPTPPVPVGFPLAAWDAWKAHPRSVPKTQALEAAVDGWLAGSH